MDINIFQEKFGINNSYKFNITEEVYNSFQICSQDMNPLHTDETFAKEKGFVGRVMYGNILNAFLSYFIGETLPTKNVIIHSQNISFKNPFYLNDEIFLTPIISGVFESVNTIEFKFKFSNQDKIVVAKGRIQIGLLS